MIWCFPAGCAGIPIAVVQAGISVTTTDPAPILHPSPMVTGPRMIPPAPMTTLFPMVGCLSLFLMKRHQRPPLGRSSRRLRCGSTPVVCEKRLTWFRFLCGCGFVRGLADSASGSGRHHGRALPLPKHPVWDTCGRSRAFIDSVPFALLVTTRARGEMPCPSPSTRRPFARFRSTASIQSRG